MLFNATQAEELRVAIVDGQTLLDFDIETNAQNVKKGNIYKGVITRIEPSLEACFIDYGTGRQGFLPFKEVSRSFYSKDYDRSIRPKIQDVLKEGMTLLIQVEKDERGNKGAALTTYIGLAGRYLVLMPNNPKGGGISRRVDGDDRQELKEILSKLKVPKGMSIIARTAGIGRCVDDLEWDLNYLVQLWKAIEEAYNKENIQNLLLQESDLVIRAIRDYFQPDIGEILIDNEKIYNKVYQFISLVMPNNLNRIKLYKDHKPLFVRFHIEDQIESAYNRVVELEHGGSIVIDHTEALVSIDVNSSKSTKGSDVEETAFRTNLDAVKEITRQIRLRDLGGLIVIDFIDMLNQKNQRDIENTLKECLKKDRARVQMGKISKFGLLELSRQRLQISLGESSHIMCPRCNGTGAIRGVQSTALQVLRLIQQQSEHATTLEIQAQLPVEVATFLLNEKRSELSNLENISGKPIILIPNLNLETPKFEIIKITEENNRVKIPSYERVKNNQFDKLNINNKFSNNNTTQKNVKSDAAVNIINHIQQAPDKSLKKPLLKRLFVFIDNLLVSKDNKLVNDNSKTNNNSYKSFNKNNSSKKRNLRFENKKKNFLNDINSKGTDRKVINNKNYKSNASNLKNEYNTRTSDNNKKINDNNQNVLDTKKDFICKNNLDNKFAKDNYVKNLSDTSNSNTNNDKNLNSNAILLDNINIQEITENIQDTVIEVLNQDSNNLNPAFLQDKIEKKDYFNNHIGTDFVLVETSQQSDDVEFNDAVDTNNLRRLDKNIVNLEDNVINLNTTPSTIKMEQIITKNEDN